MTLKNWEKWQRNLKKINKQQQQTTQNLEEDKSIIFYFITKYFSFLKWYDFHSGFFSQWATNISCITTIQWNLRHFNAPEQQYELIFIWGVTCFSWSISNLKYIFFLFCSMLFVSGIHIGISESPSQFSWSTFETAGNNTTRNWHELYYFCANNDAIYYQIFLLSLVLYFSSKHFVVLL